MREAPFFYRVSFPRLSFVLAVLFSCSLLVALLGCTQDSTSVQSKEKTPTVVNPGSYEEVYEAIHTMQAEYQEDQKRFSDTTFDQEISSNESLSTMDSSGASGFSQTNVQVEGIDEGDIMKSDGSYLYLISGSEVVIVSAEGEATTEISRIEINSAVLGKEGLESSSFYPSEIYVEGNRLLVIYSYFPNSPDTTTYKESTEEYYFPTPSNTITEVALFDIEDRRNPVYITSIGQDGSGVSSRLMDGVLYLATTYFVFSEDELSPDDPQTYVPCLYTDSKSSMVPADSILLWPDSKSISYAVLSSIDINNATRVDSESLLGAGNTLYMSPDNIYLAETIYESIEAKSYQDGSFMVTEYESGNYTNLARYQIERGTLNFAAQGQIPGYLLNQFSMDEYEDHLRLVTTLDSIAYRTLDDGNSTVYDYSVAQEGTSTNSLFVLDSQLQTTGSIEGLAEKERVYAVRFAGEVGYFVTFEQVDPLFTVDLSDPTNPLIKSALKIPGFSNYLQPYSPNRLFGLGMSADPSGVTTSLKLTMFDTIDPYAVLEKHTEELSDFYSEAQYNHKAALVDAEHDLIGFPGVEAYHLYGYSDEKGFYLRHDFTSEEEYYSLSQRAFYAGDYFYLCAANNIGVYTLNEIEEVKQLPLEMSEGYGMPVYPLME